MITKEYLREELRRRIESIKPGVKTKTDNTILEMKSILMLVDALPDYEKRYNEALEVMRQWIAPCHTKKQLDVMKESVFPELRESEDERIRKEIINYLDFAESHNLLRAADYEKKKGWLSYLEKQKDAFENGRQLGIMQEQARQELGWPDEKQKEQKPAEWSEEKEKAVDNYADEIIKWEDAHKDWDRQVIRATAYHFFNFQPKQEWSEEDEKKILFIERLIKYHVPEGRYGYIDKSVTKLQAITMLKSLRPSWKPSEEQMEMLKCTIDYYGSHTPKELVSLYEQLKKL